MRIDPTLDGFTILADTPLELQLLERWQGRVLQVTPMPSPNQLKIQCIDARTTAHYVAPPRDATRPH